MACGSFDLFFELLELLLGGFAALGSLLGKLFSLGLLNLIQLFKLLLARWHTVTSLLLFSDAIGYSTAFEVLERFVSQSQMINSSKEGDGDSRSQKA